MCGEKYGGQSRLPETQGSPPRVRGKAAAQSQTLSRSRITPACAGKRLRPRRTALGSRNHPRVCGEKTNGITPFLYRLGSPPRVRGKVGHALHVGVGVGITPACAGKSKFPRERGAGSWDHPRVCGEKDVTPGDIADVMGSPPRVRGKGHPSRVGVFGIGITPACAGKSCAATCAAAAEGGSPPRVRGKAPHRSGVPASA